MKIISTLSLLVFFFQPLNAQIAERVLNTIEVYGNSKMIVLPDVYKVQIFIQEEEQKVNYQTIGKTSIDSIKYNLFKTLKKYSIDEKDVKLVAISSQSIGQYPFVLNNISYEVQIKDKERGKQLVNEMRFPGLKGVVVKGQYAIAAQMMQDSIYEDAIKDAYRTASVLAKKVNKTVGDVRSIAIQERFIPSIGRDADDIYYNPYGTPKFEMEFRDKIAFCVVKVAYEFK